MSEKVKRLKKRICSLKQILKDLRTRNLLSSENARLLDGMPEICKELQKRKLGKQVKYSAELRKFALTLCFFSPKAYNYVRKSFDTCLPHQSTIGKWYKNINAEPGFTKESFSVLQKHVSLSEKPVILALVIDEMAIRKKIEWDGKKFHGFVNYGIELEDDANSAAKEAFVLLVVCINGQWKLPVGYFLSDGLNGDQKSTLILQCIELILKTGAQVVSLTFDGAPSNVAMTNVLGCNNNITNLKPYFSFKGNNIYTFYDPSHMLKLIRNTFGEKKVLIDCKGGFIKWCFVEKLEKLQDSEGLHLANKLRKAHIHFFKQKMKVRLAVQLMSESVADAISYCAENLKLIEFRDCQATVDFIKLINNCFDILNSRSLIPPSFKKSLCEKNIEKISNYIEECINYIASLKFGDGELIINSKRKTGFVGFIISLKSALALYNELIYNKKLLIYLPLYKVSQDHLELFFSSVRSKGGWNNNPTARQFSAAYKRLIIRTEIREGGIGNCIPLEDIPILSGSNRYEVPDHNINHPTAEENLCNDLQTTWNDHDYLMNTQVLSEYSAQIIIYIAGFVVHQLEKVIRCEHCIGALMGEKENFLNSLISKKNHGGLTYPSKDVIEICTMVEHFIRVNEASILKTHFVKMLKSKMMHECIESNFFSGLRHHILSCRTNHIYFLMESVISKYVCIRIHFITKRHSEIANPIRSHLTKLILFKGQ